MALDITYENGRSQIWHVNQPQPLTTNDYEVKHVYADGEELEKIKAEITGIPMSGKRVVGWHGDLAKFIIANLNYNY